MRSREYAERLLRKAAQDEFTIDKLVPDPDAPDEVIGFHAQQAVEKMLKAVLAAHGIRFRRTHDLVELIDLARDSGIVFPPELEEVRRLTPFATGFRYDDFLTDSEESLDRSWAVRRTREMRSWAQSMVRELAADAAAQGLSRTGADRDDSEPE